MPYERKTRQLSIRVTPSLKVAVDQARDLVPLQTWVTRLMEEASGYNTEDAEVTPIRPNLKPVKPNASNAKSTKTLKPPPCVPAHKWGR